MVVRARIVERKVDGGRGSSSWVKYRLYHEVEVSTLLQHRAGK